MSRTKLTIISKIGRCGETELGKRRLHKSIYRSKFVGKRVAGAEGGRRGGIGEVVIMWREQFFASGDAFRSENRPLPVRVQKPSRDLLLS